MGIGSAAASLPMDESRRSIPSLAEALAALATPGVAERCSPLTGAGAFVVDLRRDDGAGGDRAALTLACERLRSLPCPTVGVGPLDASSPRVAALAATLDVLVTTPAQWAVIDEAIRAAPIAAMTVSSSMASVLASRASTLSSTDEHMISAAMIAPRRVTKASADQ